MRTTFQIELTPELLTAFRKLAESRGTNMAALAREIMYEAIVSDSNRLRPKLLASSKKNRRGP